VKLLKRCTPLTCFVSIFSTKHAACRIGVAISPSRTAPRQWFSLSWSQDFDLAQMLHFGGARSVGLGQGIFVEPALLHNDQEVLVGVRYEANVLYRIAVDHEQIRECPLLDDAELARVRIS
jgi:hypothetical protein